MADDEIAGSSREIARLRPANAGSTLRSGCATPTIPKGRVGATALRLHGPSGVIPYVHRDVGRRRTPSGRCAPRGSRTYSGTISSTLRVRQVDAGARRDERGIVPQVPTGKNPGMKPAGRYRAVPLRGDGAVPFVQPVVCPHTPPRERGISAMLRLLSDFAPTMTRTRLPRRSGLAERDPQRLAMT
jgi:hypothetical protein